MIDNIDKVTQRGEKLEDINERAGIVSTVYIYIYSGAHNYYVSSVIGGVIIIIDIPLPKHTYIGKPVISAYRVLSKPVHRKVNLM